MLHTGSCVDSPHTVVGDVADLLCAVYASNFSIYKQASTCMSLIHHIPCMAHKAKLASGVRSNVVHVYDLMNETKWR